MTVKEKIEVMQAFVNGKQIEGKSKKSDEWKLVENPVWDWGINEYRVKHEPMYRPYINTNEMISDWMKRFGTYDTNVVMPPIWVKDRNGCKYHIIEYILYDSVGLFTRIETLTELFKNYTYLDGTPCGKEVSE